MTIADKLALLEQTKEAQRVKLGLPKNIPFSRYHEFFQFKFASSYLFLNGEQGVWFDPSDLKTMFQDVNATEPVTKDGDPVALIKDKSGNNNHAAQPTASARPIYRRGDGRGIVNLIENSETFLQSRATNSKVVKATNILSPTGTDNVTYFTADINAKRPRYTTASDHLGTYSVYAKAGTWDKLFVGSSNGGGYWSVICFDLSQGTILNTYSVSTGARVGNPVITPVGDGWYRCSVESIVASRFILMPSMDGSNPVFDPMTNEEEGGVYLWGMQSEYSTTVTPYQVNGNHLGGIATGKETDLHWLEFDGVDDTLETTGLPFYSEFIASVSFRAITNGTRRGMDNIIFGTTGHVFAIAGIAARNEPLARSVGGYVRVVSDISARPAIVTDPNTRFFRPLAITSSSVSGKIKTLSEEGIIEGTGDIPKAKKGEYTRSIAIAPALARLGSIAFYGGVFVINPKNEESLENLQLFMQDITGEG